MKVLVVGSGCREHALIQALKQDSQVEQVYSLPQRPSLQEIEFLDGALLKNWENLSDALREKKISLIVVGPEQPLVDGLADFLRKKGFKVFGPSQGAAQLEGSKVFSKKFMKKYQIPTASYQVVSSVSQVLKEASNFFPPYVLKADGLAGGKGVFLCDSLKELEDKARFLFEEKGLGHAGEQGILEDFQKGEEISIFVLAHGEDYLLLPSARDYKRLREGQKGPNTGGMGAIAPMEVSSSLISTIETAIVKPTLKGLKQEGLPYSGILYLGLMVHKEQPKVLEYNIRFGDPEAQVLLPLLEGSWAQVFYQVASGNMPSVQWKNKHVACVVLASSGYPESPVKGSVIQGSLKDDTLQSYFLHGGVTQKNSQWVTNGGRVLNAIALGDSREQAIHQAYNQLKKVHWEGLQYRKDIGS